MKLFYCNFPLFYLLSSVVSSTEEEISPNDEIERDLRQRITGGESVGKDDYPWFVHLGSKECGGSLVAPQFILTAAHCEKDEIFGNAHIGKLCKNQDNCGQKKEIIRVTDSYPHEEYNHSPSSHDIMLLKLSEPSTITPVDMDFTLSDTYEEGRDDLWTLGFGFTDFYSQSVSSKLQHLELKYADNDTCNLAYADDDYTVNNDMMCAVNDDVAKQACFGDSGGPLYDKASRVLVGITSWGDDDCTSKMVVYSRVSNQIDWIKSTICDNHDEPKPDYCNPLSDPLSESPSEAPSVSLNPTISNRPSVISDSPSLAPSMITSSPSLAPQTTYFQIVAKTLDDDKLCIQGGSRRITLQPCDDNVKKQLWRAGLSGQIHSYYHNDACMTNVRRSKKRNTNLVMEKCEDEGEYRLREVFVFNGFQNSILNIRSKTNWQEKGFKAISAKDVAIDGLVTLEWHHYGDFNRGYLQKWDIEYPNIIVEMS